MRSMTNNDQLRLLWDDCGILDFRLCTILKLFSFIFSVTCLGCKWSLVQIQSRRPTYLSIITTQLSFLKQFLTASLFINFGRIWWVLVDSIVGNCGIAVLSLKRHLKFNLFVIISSKLKSSRGVYGQAVH